jgi:hypothetical protein
MVASGLYELLIKGSKADIKNVLNTFIFYKDVVTNYTACLIVKIH